MTDTPPHIDLAIERVVELKNAHVLTSRRGQQFVAINAVTYRTICDLAIKALTPPPPGQYEDLCRRLGSRMESRYDSKLQGAEWHNDELCQEAAAAITDLQQQVGDAKGKALETDGKPLREFLEPMVRKAMQTSWDDICSDTGFFPIDIEKVGRGKLMFSASHWADSTAMHLAHTIIALKDKRPSS